MRLARALVVGSIVWPTLLAAATLDRAARGAPSAFSRTVYAAASRVCHQRPDRSFRTRGVPWPVCGRCAGLYGAAPVGALLMWARRRRPMRVEALLLLALASLPTIATLVVEWSGLSPLSNTVRAAAALPLGAVIAAIVVREASRPAGSIR
jgi:uncharacterized membrane protein